ncbi:MAG: hypothetical protein ACXWU6_00715 [Allosphingosinicella sp.]
MNKILLSMAAVGAIAVAAPAASQSNWNGDNGNSWNANANANAGIANRIARLDARLQAGIRSGDINATEARNLRARLRYLTRLEGRYGANGLTQAERRDLNQRLRAAHQQIRVADNGRYDRDTRYSWDDRYDNEDVYSGRGGPYEQPYDTYCDNNDRGGIGGLISGILGGGRDNDCTLRVGSRVPSNLYAVPSQYRYQFRDGNGVYYRSDGRNIYQIDARTQTVLRIYDMN